MKNDVIYLGTEIKPYIELKPVGTLNMDDYDFTAEYYCCRNKKVIIKKEEMIRVNQNRYMACLNTLDVGTGILKCLITRHIPDADFPDGIRTEVWIFVHDNPIVDV